MGISKQFKKRSVMLNSAHKLLLSYWQYTTLKWLLIVTLFLLALQIAMFFLPSKTKNEEEKIYTIFSVLFLSFFVLMVFSAALAISFWVDSGLGLGLSLIAGSFVILGVVSTVVVFIRAVRKMPNKASYFWLSLSMVSMILVGGLMIKSVENQKNEACLSFSQTPDPSLGEF
ncbi:MAG: hypothetical protein KDK64_01090 [Chlamydiia bacterium]|nr:hypothetical protein [Chlamydiia bacterium]